MFYLRYVRNELVRRRARTILTALGLGLGVALVIVIAGVSSGLDKAQKKTLNPLAGIGTDLTVTLTPAHRTRAAFQGGRRGGGGGNRDLIQSNLSVVTDLSKLGKPGTHFVHDFFLPGTQLDVQAERGRPDLLDRARRPGDAGPDVARRAPGGRRPEDRRDPEDAGEDDHADAARASVRGRLREDAGLPGEGRDQLRARQRDGGGGGGSAAATVAAASAETRTAASRAPDALRSRNACRPRSSGSASPRRAKRCKQVLNPPQTNIKTTAYTIGGVDQTHPTMGVVTTAQVVKGKYLSPAGGRQALISQTYAAKHALKVGSTLDLNGTKFLVVGLVSPPLGGQSADVYLPLAQLQTLANQKGMANVVLVRASSGKDVSQVKQEIQTGAAAGPGRELEGRRRQDHRLARRRVEPVARSRLRRSRSSPPSPRSCSPRLLTMSVRWASAFASSAR